MEELHKQKHQHYDIASEVCRKIEEEMSSGYASAENISREEALQMIIDNLLNVILIKLNLYYILNYYFNNKISI